MVFIREEVGVSVESVFAIGCLSMMAATGVMNAADSFATGTNPADPLNRIGHGGSIYSSGQTMSN